MRYGDLCHGLMQCSSRGIWEWRLFTIPVNDPDSSYQYPERARTELMQEDSTPSFLMALLEKQEMEMPIAEAMKQEMSVIL